MALAPEALVWNKPDSTWAWQLADIGDGRTRLKAACQPGPFLPVTALLMQVGDFPMLGRMLLGLAEWVETSARRTAITPQGA